MTYIERPPSEPVEIEQRRSLSPSEKLERWEACGCVCAVCGKPCEASGPNVVWDHRIPLWMGGTNDLANFEPNHAGECAAKKTAADTAARFKVKRIHRTLAGEKRPGPKLRSRGFQRDPLRGDR